MVVVVEVVDDDVLASETIAITAEGPSPIGSA
jgi:hypothetical protein